ncbi:uracil-DNA glycosylase [Boudabousia tangfeifanii]|uniref:Uracil-DNA glycosylase n=1 Tax=Boudabousia tangfeifanii TaxID=1912795 RepID=A0A1D9MLK3_9ACTO|nr:uracil-DNA glycosylase [Boudabousia tangfeifanii]AOZ73040.1 uracil-DNA glycosylase [Boudabousia tangfeifanii]
MADFPPLTLDQMAPDWAQAMAPQAPLLARINQELAQLPQPFLPTPENVFNAFCYPMSEVKVLILGQDPYPTPGDAMGLSFSVSPTSALPRSLRNIYRELEDDLGIPPATNGDLRPWCQQGVMLLNRVLTVTPGEPASHQKLGWEEFTAAAISALVARQKPLVAILWGKAAQSATPLLGQTPIIASAHPSPLSASRGFFGSKPFSRANAALVAQGQTEIDWRLPA